MIEIYCQSMLTKKKSDDISATAQNIFLRKCKSRRVLFFKKKYRLGVWVQNFLEIMS